MFEYKVDRKRLNFDLWIAVSLITMLFFHFKVKHRSALYHHFFSILSFVCAMKQEIETSANLLDIQFNFIILYEVFWYCCCEKRECFFLQSLFYAGSSRRLDENYMKWFRFARKAIVWFLKRVNSSVSGVYISRNL